MTLSTFLQDMKIDSLDVYSYRLERKQYGTRYNYLANFIRSTKDRFNSCPNPEELILKITHNMDLSYAFIGVYINTGTIEIRVCRGDYRDINEEMSFIDFCTYFILDSARYEKMMSLTKDREKDESIHVIVYYKNFVRSYIVCIDQDNTVCTTSRYCDNISFTSDSELSLYLLEQFLL